MEIGVCRIVVIGLCNPNLEEAGTHDAVLAEEIFYSGAQMCNLSVCRSAKTVSCLKLGVRPPFPLQREKAIFRKKPLLRFLIYRNAVASANGKYRYQKGAHQLSIFVYQRRRYLCQKVVG